MHTILRPSYKKQAGGPVFLNNAKRRDLLILSGPAGPDKALVLDETAPQRRRPLLEPGALSDGEVATTWDAPRGQLEGGRRGFPASRQQGPAGPGSTRSGSLGSGGGARRTASRTAKDAYSA